MARPSLEVGLVTSSQDGDVFSGMALRRRNVGDATVPILEVVPMHEVAPPGAGLVEISEAAYGEVGPVLAGSEIPVI